MIAVIDKIEVKIGDLDVGQAFAAADIVLPEGAELAEAGTTPIVSCSEKAQDDDSEEASASAE